MKFNQWTLGLAAAGVISLPSVVQAEEAQHQVMTALQSTTLSGYVSTSAIWHIGGGNAPDGLPGRSYDGPSKQDGFNLDVVKLQLEKALDEGQWSAGYQVGLLFGPDANAYDTSSTGINVSDFAIKDANVTLRAPLYNGVDFKVGYWENPVGCEVFDSGTNPNFSRSFGYTLEPKQFTGVLVSYRFSEVVSISGGIADSGDPDATHPPAAIRNKINGSNRSAFGTVESLKTYLGAIQIKASESAGMFKGAEISAGFVNSAYPAAPNVTTWYVGVTVPTPMEGLSLGGALDYRQNERDDGNGYSASYAYAVALYMRYQMTEKLKFFWRGEFAHGSNGTWYDLSPRDVYNPITGALIERVRHRDNEIVSNTFTLDYDLWGPSVITRAELRWDHETQGNGVFNDGSDKNALSVALNVIYKF